VSILNITFGFDYDKGVVSAAFNPEEAEGPVKVQQFSMLRFHPAWLADSTMQRSGFHYVAGCPAWYEMHAGPHLEDPKFWSDSMEEVTYGRGDTQQAAWEDMVARCIYAQATVALTIAEKLAGSDEPSSDATTSPEGGDPPG
jgi:hypothetical protein